MVEDCVAFNQFIGAGLKQIPGYVVGECFGRARLAAGRGDSAARTDRSTWRCRVD